MTNHIVIIGAGECGTRAALALREEGFDGDVTLIGAERHMPYERPPLSKALMQDDAPPAPATIATAERLAGAGITFRGCETVAAIERDRKRLRLADGGTLAYDKLLLATGAAPHRMPGVGGPGVAYLRTFDDAVAIRSHLVAGARIAIVGGGFIGLELAASARRRGAAVTLIEAQPRLLARGVPESLANRIEAEHRMNGVELIFADRIAGLLRGDAGTRVTLASGRTVEADLAIVGIGAAPVTDLAAAAGLAIDNGIAVDATLQTGDPDIYAAGDCCSYPLAIYGGRRVRLESWRNAQDQGSLAARNLMGANEQITSVPWFWSDQYALTLQIAGLIDEGVETVVRESGDGAVVHFHLSADGRLVAASGLGPGNAVARDIRLAEMLIGRGARPDRAALGDAGVKLKGLLAAA